MNLTHSSLLKVYLMESSHKVGNLLLDECEVSGWEVSEDLVGTIFELIGEDSAQCCLASDYMSVFREGLA